MTARRTSLKRLKAQAEASARQARIYGRAAALLEAELDKLTREGLEGVEVEAGTLEHEIERLRAHENELNADASMLKIAQADYLDRELERLMPEIDAGRETAHAQWCEVEPPHSLTDCPDTTN